MSASYNNKHYSFQLYGEAAGGWLSGLFKKVVATQTQPTTPTKKSQNPNQVGGLRFILNKHMISEYLPKINFSYFLEYARPFLQHIIYNNNRLCVINLSLPYILSRFTNIS